MLYIAYGSNMDWSQMRERCPSTRFVAAAKLKDHRLDFIRESTARDCGVADAVPERGHEVWGVVYEIDERDLGQLDRSEGFAPGRKRNAYVREARHVYADGDEENPIAAFVYFAVRQARPPLPGAEYKQLIVEGAKFWHLPEEYVQKLEKIETAS